MLRCFNVHGVKEHHHQVTKNKEWAFTVMRNRFQKIDANHMGQIEFLDFALLCYELCLVLPISPAAPMLKNLKRWYEERCNKALEIDFEGLHQRSTERGWEEGGMCDRGVTEGGGRGVFQRRATRH